MKGKAVKVQGVLLSPQDVQDIFQEKKELEYEKETLDKTVD